MLDSYGNTLSLSGPQAEANPYRFSSKECHANAGLYYYGYRFYEPSLQRWLNRDPLEEKGGINLSMFANNNPINNVDSMGKSWWDVLKCPKKANEAMKQQEKIEKQRNKLIDTLADPESTDEEMDKEIEKTGKEIKSGIKKAKDTFKKMPGTSITGPAAKPKP